MQRILLLITDLEIGGTPTVVREIAFRLRGEASIYVACLSRSGPVADDLRAANIAVTALNAKHRFDLRIVRSLLQLIDGEQIDTVFSFLAHANALAALSKVLRPQLRILQSIQTTQPKPRWHWWLGAACQRAADAVVVPSDSVAEAARARSRVPLSKIRIIPNAVEAPLVFERIPTSDGVFRVGFLGRLDPIKRIEDLIAAMSLLPASFQLSIYGGGLEEPKLRRVVEQYSLADRVEFKGVVASPWIAIAAMDALVLPSDAEGFGLVLIEAMAVGVAVVATDVPGIRDVVRHARTGLLVPPRDSSALARAIEQVSRDVSMRQRLTQAAAADVRERFAWDRVLPMYRRLLLR